jgi:Domain of unknown function (DUF4349)
MPELLEDDVRATAPQPREEFVQRLEERVEAGFAKPKRPRRRWSLWSVAAPVAAMSLVALVVAFAVIANNSSQDDEGSAGATSADAPQSVQESSGSSTAEPQLTSPAPRGDAVAPGSQPRKVERRTALELRTGDDDFGEVTGGVLRVADATGTIVQRSNVTEQDGRGFATYDLRVPTSRLDDALAQLSRLADVTSRSASADDITASFVSARDRLQDARDERRALLRALAGAESESQRTQIASRLAAVRGRIARAERDVRRIQARTDRARVDVTVRSTGESGSWTPGDALDDAGRILEVVAGVLLVAGAVLAPLLALLAAAVAASRLARRRRRNAVLG